MEEIIICKRCSTSCENGYSATWNEDGSHQDEICFKCDKKERIERYAKDKVLSTRLMTESILHRNDDRWGRARQLKHDEWTIHQLQEISKSIDKIEFEVELFDREVWFGGLSKFVHEAKHSGYSAKFGKLFNKNKFLSFTSAGRVIIQLEKPDGTFISLIQLDEDLNDSNIRTDYGLSVPKMGIQGILATANEAIELLQEGREAWKIGKIKLKQSSVGF